MLEKLPNKTEYFMTIAMQYDKEWVGSSLKI